MDLKIQDLNLSDIKSLEEKLFGQNGKLEYLKELKDIECYCELEEEV